MHNSKLSNIAIILLVISIISQKNYKVFCKKDELKFNSSGEFKIVQFTDLHEHYLKNEKTIKLIEDILNSEKPDFVILTGDNIDGKFMSKKKVKKIIANIAKPMEERKIPWAVVLGNHDSEFCMVNRKNQMKMYMSYKYNLSKDFSSVQERAGDYNLLIRNSKNTKNIFNIYLLDSGAYNAYGYGYIKKAQIDWYEKLSTKLRKDSGTTIPSLMFFHIALQQQYKVWESGKFTGKRNERECEQQVDCKLISALGKMGDVKGVFVGHDHINDYLGSINGITLGYGRCSGYNGYGKNGFRKGARVFILNEKDPENFKTYEKLE